MSVRISQREARRLRARVVALERYLVSLRTRWGAEYPGTHVGTEENVTVASQAKVSTAIRLGFPVVCRIGDNNTLRFFAVECEVKR